MFHFRKKPRHLPLLRLHPSLILLPLLLPAVGSRTLFAALAAAALHESGHIAALILAGTPPRSVTLLPFGAVISAPGVRSYRADAFVFAAGPVAGAVAVLPLFLLHADPVCEDFIRISLMLSSFNLLPVTPLDGGSLLRCLLAPRLGPDAATSVAAAVSLPVLLFLLGAAVFIMLSPSPDPALLAVCVYLFAATLR